MSEISIGQICEKIWELEVRFNLLDWEIQGIKVWQLSRFEVYYEIALKTGLFTQAHTVKDSFLDMIKFFPVYLFNSVFKNPLIGNYQKDILVLDHPRKILVDGEYIDIYTRYLLDELDVSIYDVIEMPYLKRHYSQKEQNRTYLDYVSLRTQILRFMNKPALSAEQLKIIELLEKEFSCCFDIKIDLKNIFLDNIVIFKSYYQFFDFLIKKRKFQTVYVMVSYGKGVGALIAAAKANNAKTIELQHGIVSKYHMGYSFPFFEGELEYFPDFFYSFGDYWKESVDFPIKKECIIPYGFPYMSIKKEKYNDIKKEKKEIFFISQGSIGKELSKFAFELANELEDYRLIYKLHPGEYDRWKEDYPELVCLNKLKNAEVIDHNKNDLYSYFSKSKYVVGVYSTAIYEALAFNCKIFLVDLPGIEYMDYLIKKGIVIKVQNPEELSCALESFEPIAYDEKYFFK